MRSTLLTVSVLSTLLLACGSDIQVKPGTGGSGGTGGTGASGGDGGDGATGGIGGTGGTGAGGIGPGANPPPPPPDGIPGDGSGYAFVIDQLFMGDTDLNGSPNPSAWKSFGYNLDGKISTNQSTDLCTPNAGGSPSSVYPDGDAGRDNAWGKLLLPIWTGLAQDFSAQVNAGLQASDGSFLIELPALGLMPSYLDLQGRFFQSGPLANPGFDGADMWPIGAQSLNVPSDPTSAKWSFPQTYVNQHTMVMSPTTSIEVAVAAGGFAMPFDIHHAVVTMEMAPDRSGAVNGVIAGVLDVEEHIAVLQQIAGSFDVGLCSGTTFESLADQLRQAADILVDGTQDPNQTCNGISIGIGFTATAVQLSGITPAPPPPPNPCN